MTQRSRSVQPSIAAEEPPALAPTIAELRAMHQWQPGWNGYDALPDGTIIAKSVNRQRGCTENGFSAFLNCPDPSDVPPSVMVALTRVPSRRRWVRTVPAETWILGFARFVATGTSLPGPGPPEAGPDACSGGPGSQPRTEV